MIHQLSKLKSLTIISTDQLNALLRLHLPPINLVVSEESLEAEA
jgi:hypothetical protein